MKDFTGKKILLIDDDELIHILIEEFLEATNCNLIKAKSGDEGISLFKEMKPDLVILDLHMPNINGKDVLVKLKEINKNIDVIICTCDDQHMEHTYNDGAIAYIVKPILYNSLVNIIDMVLKLKIIS